VQTVAVPEVQGHFENPEEEKDQPPEAVTSGLVKMKHNEVTQCMSQ
jgi:hypothetical protein